MRTGVVIAVLLILLLPRPAFAVLGEDRAFAERRANEWKQKYRAAAPIISTNKRGKSIAECWSGPPEGWSEKTALQFARDLLPGEVRNKAAESVDRDGHMKIIRFPGGYRITLSRMQRWGDRAPPKMSLHVLDIGVYAPEWNGPDC